MPKNLEATPETTSIDNDIHNLQTDARSEESSVDFRYAANVLWAGRRIVASAAVATMAFALICALVWPPYYTATASFIAQSSTPSASSLLASQLGSLGGAGLLGGGLKSTGDQYVGILKSRSVADNMISRFSLMSVYKAKRQSQAEKVLASHSKFDSDVKDSIVTIQVTDNDPQRARDLANGYLYELRSANKRLALTESSQRRLFFEEQLSNEKNSLANAEVDLQKSQERTGLIAPAGQTAMQIQSIAQMRAQIADREVELAGLRQSATDQNPGVVTLVTEIEGLRGQLARMQSGKGAGKVGDIATSEVPELGLEYIRKAREVKYHEALFEILLKQYESARMDEARDPPLLQLLDQAIAPDVKSGPPRGLICLGGLFIGLFGGGLWVLFRAARERSTVSSEI
jgi:tyrosine-protein kinase Etk/Wzc